MVCNRCQRLYVCVMGGVLDLKDVLINKAKLHDSSKHRFEIKYFILKYIIETLKLTVEICKVSNDLALPLLNWMYVPVSRPENLRRNDTLQRRRVKLHRTYHRTHLISST